MRILRPVHGAVLAGMLLFGAAGEAQACVYAVHVENLGKPLTPRQKRAEARAIAARIEAETRAETLRSAQAGDLRLAKAPVDFAGELSQWLVPNIRPVWIEASSCGDVNEVDYGDGTETAASLIQRFLGGTPYEDDGVSLQWLEVHGADVFSFGDTCNEEFRRNFAATLKASVSEAHLRDAWRFLGARLRPSYVNGGLPGRNHYEHLVAFRGGTRVPPVHWTLSHPALFEEVTRYVRMVPAGRAVDAAAAGFWKEEAAFLGDDARVCPATVARLKTARTEIRLLLDKERPRAKD
jgi:hypothetical protein